MTWLKIVSILLVIDSIIILFRPDFLKKYAAVMAEGAKIYLAAAIKAVVGTVFLFGVSDKCTFPQVIMIFGILAIAGAVFVIALPHNARTITKWFAVKSSFTLRVFALIYLLVAALLVYSA
ncbi:MAG: hypothetical protein A2Y10_16800 [Planctomycetes bacterium GWF2_41_51]|nr:MAG: hypothetical protein A2Y10_16800 [Planctomycetes bacterium GWF2_41_51]HBG28873.1 hypothetical protein [Phycisphaerales bacterium]